ncbi:DUF1579 family protein [Oxalobacteraceae sp. CFBP 8761]|nr:DUF1579 family protein [Oxalobacteraceae sp. CFBP 8761]
MTRQFAALFTTCTLLAIPAQIHAQATAAGGDVRPEILRQLDGAWTMTGDVRGKPVTYRMVAKPALHGTFTELRMQDVQMPAQYEAAVFVGYDAASKTIIAHWMDSFGAKYSVPHGSGDITGNVVTFTIPYPSGPFRNTWRFDPASATWQFALEAAQPDGSWKHFAGYALRRD